MRGEPNDELISTLARALGLPKRDVRLVRGEGSRNKVVEVIVLTEDEIVQRLTESLRP